MSDKINHISPDFGVRYNFDPNLKYSYPEPNTTILTNISNALASVPRFYVQVLHLMNRMNLPPPFGKVTPAPPVPDVVSEIEEVNMDVTSEESELESSGDESKNVASIQQQKSRHVRSRRQLDDRKRVRSLLSQDVPTATGSESTNKISVGDMFEAPAAKVAKRIEIKHLPTTVTPAAQPTDPRDLTNEGKDNKDDGTSVIVEGGFGKLEPNIKDVAAEEEEEEDGEVMTDFISSRALRRGRISEREMRDVNAFKRYERGEPSSRLYIKNIAKQTSEADLRYVFGRYVNWDNVMETNAFDIRLMTEGRMKGQAFVSLSSVEKATSALRDTHGFELNGKPLVVSFARSAKAKADTVSSVNKK